MSKAGLPRRPAPGGADASAASGERLARGVAAVRDAWRGFAGRNDQSPARASPLAIEALEPRVLLAADFGVAISHTGAPPAAAMVATHVPTHPAAADPATAPPPVVAADLGFHEVAFPGPAASPQFQAQGQGVTVTLDGHGATFGIANLGAAGSVTFEALGGRMNTTPAAVASPGATAGTYSQIVYDEVYQGIDLVFHQQDDGVLECDWLVAPNVDPNAIRMSFGGALGAQIESNGDLRLHTLAGDLMQQAPVLYQTIDGQRHDIEGRFVMRSTVPGRIEVGFEIGAYDRSKELVIDPVLGYSTYVGGRRNDVINQSVTDAQGNTYVVGTTQSPDLDPQGDPDNGRYHAFWGKYDATGKQVYLVVTPDTDDPLVHFETSGLGITTDESGAVHALVKGSSFPITDTGTPNGRINEKLLVFTLDADGAAGAPTEILGTDSAPRGDGSRAYDVFAGGMVSSGNGQLAITAGQFRETAGGVVEDDFLISVSADRTEVFKTALFALPQALALDPQGNLYLAFSTTLNDLPVSSDAIKTRRSTDTDSDVYVQVLDPDNNLVYAAYLGGSRDDFVGAIAADPDRPGVVYVAGTTRSDDFDTATAQGQQATLATNAPDRDVVVREDGFVAAVDLAGQKVLNATYLGGSGSDALTDLAIDGSGNVYVSGLTNSADFPTANPLSDHYTAGTPFASFPLPYDFVVAKLDAALKSLRFGTYLGGSDQEGATDGAFASGPRIEVDDAGTIHLSGATSSTDFPTTEGAQQPAFGGGDVYFGARPSDGILLTLAQRTTLLGQGVRAELGTPLVGAVVATFANARADSTPDQFDALIDWGDGTQGVGRVERRDGTRMYQVVGDHTYDRAGAYVVRVDVTDRINDVLSPANDVNLSNRPGSQIAPALAQDPTNPSRLVAVAASEPTPDVPGGVSVAVTSDGGQTWATRVIADGRNGALQGIENPDVLFDGFGNLYVAALVDNGSKAVVLFSRDGGLTFDKDPIASLSSGAAGGVLSRPRLTWDGQRVWLAAMDSAQGNLLLASGNVSGPAQVLAFVTRSVAVGENVGNVDIASTPKETLVAWEQLTPDAGVQIRALRYTDGLVDLPNDAIELAVNANRPGDVVIPTLPSLEFGLDPVLAVDRSHGPHAGRVYLAYHDLGTVKDQVVDGDLNVYLTWTDGGNWSEPIDVGRRSGQQFLPTVTVDPTTGVVAVGWYDTRDEGDDLQVRYYAAVSADGGDTFSVASSLSTEPFSPGTSTDSVLGTQQGPGDPPRLAFSNGVLRAVWADNGTLDGTNAYTGVFETAETAVGVIDVAPARPQIRMLPIASVKGEAFGGTVATFTVADPSRTAGDYTATIVWGDGGTSQGTLMQIASTTGVRFAVSGDHTYAEAGAYAVSVLVDDPRLSQSFAAVSDVTATKESQTDPSIAIDPTHPDRVYAISTDNSGRTASGLILSESADGGTTWSSGPVSDGSDSFPAALGNARIAFDRYGNLYVAYIGAAQPNAVVLLQSTDGGASFRVVRTFADTESASRLVMATGPGQDGAGASLWLAWQRGTLPLQTVVAAGAAISGPGGLGGFQVRDVAVAPVDGTFRDVSDIVVGPKGQVLLTYLRDAQGSDGTTSQIVTQIDADGLGSAAFGAAHVVIDSFVTPGMSLAAQPSLPIQAGARMAWDLSDGPHAGRVYAVRMTSPTVNAAAAVLSDTDIQVVFSDDDGATWSAPVLVASGDEFDRSSAEFLPVIAVDPTSGNVAVAWYRSVNGVSADTSPGVALSSDGGLTWGVPDAVLGTGPSDPNAPDLDPGGRRSFGAYMGLSFVGGVLQPIWIDNSETLAGNPDPRRFDAANARYGIAQVSRAALHVDAVALTGKTGNDDPVTVATFTDPDGQFTADRYKATIDWGDGTDASAGTVTRNDDGTLHVAGGHAYEKAGTFTVAVKIVGPQTAGSVDVPATIEAAARQIDFAEDGSVRVVRETDFDKVLAVLKDDNRASKADDFDVTIDWGDGTFSTGVVALTTAGAKGSPNVFSITGSHHYLSEATFAVKVSVRVKADPAQNLGTSGAVVSGDPDISLDVALDIEDAFAGLGTGERRLAVFSVDGDAQANVGEYTATVNWGDGSSTANVVPLVNNKDGVTVVAAHTYAEAGEYAALVTIRDDSGNTATAPLVVIVRPDATARVKAVSSGLVYDPARDRYVGELTLTNIGAADLSGPLAVVLQGLPEGVDLESTDDIDGEGNPLFKLDIGRLAAGASTEPIELVFYNPTGAAIDYAVKVFETQQSVDQGLSTLSFEPNRGQADPSASFIANGRGYSIGLTGGQATLLLNGTSGSNGATAAMTLVGANTDPRGVALEAQAGASNYVSGSTVINGVPHFGRVRYESVYTGIDLEYYGRAGLLEYDWVVRPGADVSAIGVRFEGVTQYRLAANGDLLVDSASGVLVQRAPVAWQMIGGVRKDVQASFVLRAGGVVGLSVGDHDPSVALTIDPVLVFSSYLGGNGYDNANAVAVDAEGNSYVVGRTGSSDFPTVVARDPELNQPTTPYFGLSFDSFVSKFDRDGKLVFSTYLGGGSASGADASTTASAVAVDAQGRLWVGGGTASSLFPTTAANPAPAVPGSTGGAFLTQLSADGRTVLYSTVFQGRGSILDVAVDSTGAVYATGIGGYGLKLDPSTNRLVYLTQLGDGVGRGIAVDATGQAYLAGFTNDPRFQTRNALFPTLRSPDPDGNAGDGYLAKLDADGRVMFSTYLGGSGVDGANDVALAPDGSIVVIGVTGSSDFPVAGPLQSGYGGARDGFVVRVASDGQRVLGGSYIGGSGFDEVDGVAVDGSGRIHLGGRTESSDFPAPVNAFQPAWARSDTDTSQGFFGTLTADARAFEQLDYVGGDGFDEVRSVATDADGNATFAGYTRSTDLATRDAVQASIGAFSTDGFVLRVLSRDDGRIELHQVVGQGVLGTAFDGLVATFSTNGTQTAADFSARIDWGDGIVTDGVVSGDFRSGFRVRGNHTYADAGVHDLAVTLLDSTGRTIHPTATDAGPAAADGIVRYRVSIDTSSLSGTAALLGLQFNAGGATGAPDAQLRISHLTVAGGSVGSVAAQGGVTGDPAGEAVFQTSSVLNRLGVGVVLGTRLTFDVEFDGTALSRPGSGRVADVLAVQLLRADGLAPLPRLGADVTSSLMRIDLQPDGSTRGRIASPAVTATALGQFTVSRPATRLNLSVQSFTAQQGQAFSGPVATFTSSDVAQTAGAFTALIDWGDGTAPSAGTVAGSRGAFTLSGSHAYATPGDYRLAVTLVDSDGSAVVAQSPLGGQGSLEANPMAPPFNGNSGRGSGNASLVADVNGDGRLDVFSLSYPFGNQPIVRLGTDHFGFGPDIVLPTSVFFQPQAVGDFNGDGFIDVVISGEDSSRVRQVGVLFGDGTGHFTAGPAGTVVAPFATAVSTGDFDEDGKLDIVIGTGQSSGVSLPGQLLLLRGHGDGSFDAPVTQSLAFGNVTPQVADVNGDGHADVVAGIEGASAAQVLLGDGRGHFTVSANLAAAGLRSFTVADLTGDGRLDIATIGSSVNVFIGQTDGTFKASALSSDRALGNFIGAGDLDGDGRVELVTALASTDGISAGLRTWKNVGGGDFRVADTIPALRAYSFLSIADWTGDGKLDAVVGGERGTHLYTGRGDGTLIAPTTVPTTTLPRSVVTFDANGDGRVDIVSAGSRGFTVTQNEGQGVFSDPPRFSFDNNAPNTVRVADVNGDGQNDLIEASRVNIAVRLADGHGGYGASTSVGFGSGIYEFALGDIDGDGSLDIAASVVSSGTGSTSGVAILLNNGAGAFSFRGFVGQRNDLGGGSGPQSLVLRDFNGDGKLDLAAGVQGTFVDGVPNASDNGVGVALGRGDGTFGDLTITPAGLINAGKSALAAGDLNGDGILDLASVSTGYGTPLTGDGLYVMTGKGDGTFNAATVLLADHVAGTSLRSVAMTDANGDGRLDLIAVRYSGAVNKTDDTVVLLGDGAGGFAAPLTFDGGQSPGEVRAADLNGDGRVDLIVRETGFDSDTGGIDVLLGQGDGSFGPRTRFRSGDSRGFDVADVDGDGKLDVVVADGTSAEVKVLGGRGDGSLKVPTFTELPTTPGVLTPVDFNGDGITDLLYSDAGSTVGLLIGRGNGSFARAGTASIPDVGGFGNSSPRQLTLDDIDGNGLLDVVVSLNTSGAIVSVPLDAAGTMGTPVYRNDGIAFSSQAAFGDFDGDGRLDVASVGNVFGDNTARLTVLRGRGNGSFSQSPQVVVGGTVADVRTADLNGDGHLDLVITSGGRLDADHPAGSVAVLIGAGDGSFAAPVFYSPNTAFTGTLALTDINADGFLDIAAARDSGLGFGGGVGVLVNRGDGTFGPITFYDANTPLNPRIATVVGADLAGDGAPELIVSQDFGGDGLLRIIQNRAPQAGVKVTNAPLTVTGRTVNPTVGQAFTAVVGHLVDGNPLSSAADHAATIDWGDGSRSAARIVADGNGGFDLVGSHVYATAGTRTVTLAASDVDGGQAGGTATADVSATDFALTAAGVAFDASVGTVVDARVATFTDADVNGSASDFAAVIDWGDDTTSSGRVVALPGGGFEVRGRHDYATTGVFVVKVEIDDIGGSTARAVSQATVGRGVNHPPVARDDRVVTLEDTPIAFDVRRNDRDPDAEALTVEIVEAPAHGTLEQLSDGSFTYRPAANQQDGDSFRYRVRDAAGATAEARVVIDISPVNDAPRLAAIANQRLVSGQAWVLDPSVTDADAGDMLAFTFDAAPAGATIDAQGRIRWTAGAAGTSANFVVRVTDRSGASAVRAFSAIVGVAPVNATPVLAPVADGSVPEGSLFSVQLSGTDADPGTLTYILDAAPDGATIDAAGRVRWVPLDGDATARFTARVVDAQGASSAAVSFQVVVANVAPTLAVSVPDTLRAGEWFTATLTATDPGKDTIGQWRIDWGDGSTTTLAGAAAGTAVSAEHAYAGAIARARISVQAVDEDGTWTAPALVRDVADAPAPAPAPAPGSRDLDRDGDGRAIERERERGREARRRSLDGAPVDRGSMPAPGPAPDVDSPLRVTVVEQSAHRGANTLASVVADGQSDAPHGARSESDVADATAGEDGSNAPSSDTAPPAEAAASALALQVDTMQATQRGLHARFNQAISAAALAQAGDAVVLMRGDQRIAGTIVIDPDGRGLRFDVAPGALSAGEYTVRLGADSGAFLTLAGQRLDGDYDGRAGGDYRGRFHIAADAAAPQSSTPAADELQAIRDFAERFAATHGAWGGVLSLALGPVAARRRRRTGRGPGDGVAPAAAVVAVSERADATALDFAVQPVVPAAMAAAARQRSSTNSSANDWEIRL